MGESQLPRELFLSFRKLNISHSFVVGRRTRTGQMLFQCADSGTTVNDTEIWQYDAPGAVTMTWTLTYISRPGTVAPKWYS